MTCFIECHTNGLSTILIEMAKESPKVARMGKQSESTRFIKMAKILQKAFYLHVLLNATLMKLCQKV